MLHQHIRVDATTPIGSRFFRPVEVAVIIFLGKEAGLAIDAALDEMLR
jgi:hypothetical protein